MELGDLEPKNPVNGWPAFATAMDAKIQGADPADKGSIPVIIERNGVAHELVKLSRIVCRDCGGQGHNFKRCGTRSKLTALGKRSAVAEAMVSAGRRAAEAKNRVNIMSLV